MKARVVVRVILLCVVGVPALAGIAAFVALQAANRSNSTIVSDGAPRHYLLHVPATYDPRVPTPLVISLHGANGWPAQQMHLTGWNRIADRDRVLVVYPAAAGFPAIWTKRDVRFIADLIDAVSSTYNVDIARIYADGFSQGASMAFVLACALPDRIAAIGLVAAAHEVPISECHGTRPTPMVTFHGTADPIAAYRGGANPIGPGTFPSIQTWTQDAAHRNGCIAQPVDTPVTAHVQRRDDPTCAPDRAVILYSVQGGGHQWPGAAPLLSWWLGDSTTEIDATAVTWDFFHRRSRATAVPVVR